MVETSEYLVSPPVLASGAAVPLVFLSAVYFLKKRLYFIFGSAILTA